MGYKCTPQILGLVRNEPKLGQKHRANGLKIANEMGKERYTKSKTIDRSRTHLNQYFNYTSGTECWDSMCDDASEYRVQSKTKDGKLFERSLRHDAVIGCAIIFNPPSDMTVGWSLEDYYKFDNDSFHVLNQIEPRLFRVENIKMMAKHKDEGKKDNKDVFGEHTHILCTAKDENGHYCGNLIDAALLARINKLYPSLMRERGWELDDLDITDFKRMGYDKEYRSERLKKKAGLSVNEYLDNEAKQIKEKLELEAFHNEVVSIELEDGRACLEAERASFEQEKEDYKAEIENKLKKHYTALETEMKKKYEGKYNELKTSLVKSINERAVMLNEAITANNELIKLGRQKEKEIQQEQIRQNKYKRVKESFGNVLDEWGKLQKQNNYTGFKF